MSDFSIRVFDHNWGRVQLPAGITFAPQTWSAEAIGGSANAEVTATGDALRLVELSNWVGYTIWIMSPDNEYVWWGDITEVTLTHNDTTIGSTLDGVANRIAVAYTDSAPGGEMDAAETGWAQDNASMALYGRRERLHTAQNPMRAAQAEQMRDTLLGRVSRPIATVGQVMPESGETQATLRCQGFWWRLGNIYYANDNGLVEHTTGSTPWPLGMGFTSDFVAAVSNDGKYTFHQAYGRFANFKYPDLRITVTGTGSNDNIYTVLSNDEREPVAYTADTIKFVHDDDIEDSARGLAPFEPDDVIVISGSILNSGTHRVKSAPDPGRIEVSPGYHGDTIQHEMPGPDITILRGNHIEVEQVVTNEHVGASVTVTAHGERIAQAFHTYTSEAWTLASVELKMRKVGTPTDGVYVRLRADGSVSPDGTILDSAFLDDADITDSDEARWVEFVMTGGVTLNPSTLYWLEIIRSDVNDSANYYEVYVDDTGSYAGGGVLLHDGATYVSPLNPLSVSFRLLGAVDTALQVADICEAADVFVSVQVADLSALETNQYRSGSLYALNEARELLDTGDGSHVRLIATVNPQRWALIRKQPDRAQARYLWRDGALYTLQGVPVSQGLLPVGEWCILDNPLLLQGALAHASPFFVEAASYTVDQGWQLRAAGEPDPWAIGETRDG